MSGRSVPEIEEEIVPLALVIDEVTQAHELQECEEVHAYDGKFDGVNPVKVFGSLSQ